MSWSAIARVNAPSLGRIGAELADLDPAPIEGGSDAQFAAQRVNKLSQCAQLQIVSLHQSGEGRLLQVHEARQLLIVDAEFVAQSFEIDQRSRTLPCLTRLARDARASNFSSIPKTDDVRSFQ